VAGRRAEQLAITALRHLELVHARDLVAHADAARAEDAALLVEHDRGPEVDDLVLLDLDARRCGELRVPIEVVLLQHALARLVADRAVDRVVDQRELEHLAADVHARGDLVITSTWSATGV
jgi:hypothetical protein